MFKKPNIFCHFALGVGDPKYMPIDHWPHLQKLLNDALDAYNELNAQMNLVLFEDAMTHICRINRILEAPRGNALLIGVGGSGKQSLARLAASISSLEVFQITLRKGPFSALRLPPLSLSHVCVIHRLQHRRSENRSGRTLRQSWSEGHRHGVPHDRFSGG